MVFPKNGYDLLFRRVNVNKKLYFGGVVGRRLSSKIGILVMKIALTVSFSQEEFIKRNH